MTRVFWFLLDDARWRPFVGPVRNRREAEAVLRSMFGDRLRAVGASPKRAQPDDPAQAEAA